MGQAEGTHLGGFELGDRVARGGSGEVWRARDADGNLVAVKLFDRSDDAPAEARRIAAAAGIDGVVDLIDQGDGWIATTFVEGRTLAHLIETEGPLSAGRTRRLLGQLASVLDQLHAIGLVHADLSPSNAIVDLHDQVTLVDLGDGAAVEGPLTDTTSRLEVRTTPRYASPEVASGGSAGPASDRYALGLIAYEALTGWSPFPTVDNPMAMLGHHLSTVPAPLSESAPSLGARFDSTFERALAKDPDQRFADASSFIAALESPDEHPPRRRATDLHEEPDGPMKRSTMALIAAFVVAAIASVIALNGGEQTEPVVALNDIPPEEDWAAGRAAGIACNLIMLPGFEQDRLPENWYGGEPGPAISLVPGAGINGSTALQVGVNGRYGLVGERVPVVGGESYHFSAWIRRQADPTESGMWIEYETADFGDIDEVPRNRFASVDEVGDRNGMRITQIHEAPPEAAWAIPTFFKDSSEGSLLVDEIVFGPLTECADVPS